MLSSPLVPWQVVPLSERPHGLSPPATAPDANASRATIGMTHPARMRSRLAAARQGPDGVPSKGLGMSTSRLEAFSDGVFAVAITLLVLDIRPPQEAESSSALWHGLGDLWPHYAAYAV